MVAVVVFRKNVIKIVWYILVLLSSLTALCLWCQVSGVSKPMTEGQKTVRLVSAVICFRALASVSS